MSRAAAAVRVLNAKGRGAWAGERATSAAAFHAALVWGREGREPTQARLSDSYSSISWVPKSAQVEESLPRLVPNLGLPPLLHLVDAGVAALGLRLELEPQGAEDLDTRRPVSVLNERSAEGSHWYRLRFLSKAL